MEKQQKSYLLFTSNFEKARTEINKAGGHVTQKFTDSVFAANLPVEMNVKELKESFPDKPENLDALSETMVKAWEMRLAKRKMQEGQPNLSLNWDTKGFQYPTNPENDDRLRLEFERIKAGLKTALPFEGRTMTGSIMVGLLIVSGTGTGLGFTPEEQAKVVSEVQEGLDFLATEGQPYGVTFIYDIHFITITAVPHDNCDNGYESCEAVFRDPALNSLGYVSGYQGCLDYVNDLKTQHHTQWAYVAFFTKYPLYYFAYTYDIKIIMQYSNDTWGPDALNQVLAHESCHVFGAADEYTDSGCSCNGSGVNNVPNYNCENCSKPFYKTPCLMKKNDLTICEWTQGQIGWGPYPVQATMGVCDGFVMVLGRDGNLWAYGNNLWQNFRTPTGVSIVSAMGTTFVYVFILGSDGNLYYCDITTSSWANLKTPEGISIHDSMGASGAAVFVRGNDGNVYGCKEANAWGWKNYNKPNEANIISSVGAVLIGTLPSELVVYVICSDGTLGCLYSNPNFWANLGTLGTNVSAVDPMGANSFINSPSFPVDKSIAAVAVTGTDGQLYTYIASSYSQGWSQYGQPGEGISINEAMGVACFIDTSPYVCVYVTDTNNNLYCCDAGTWTNLGTPSADVSIVGAAGVASGSGNWSLVYVLCSDGCIWGRSSSGNWRIL